MLLNFEQLSEWYEYKRPSDVKKILEKNGIKYQLDRQNRPITTLDAINEKLLDDEKGDDWGNGFA